MKRPILAFAVGLVVWVLVFSVLNRALGTALLVAFILIHVQLWSLFPFWYHLVFLATLIPLVVLGSWLTRARPVAGATAGGAGT
jgi:hypothetical protein